jgi:hypothetical protein
MLLRRTLFILIVAKLIDMPNPPSLATNPWLGNAASRPVAIRFSITKYSVELRRYRKYRLDFDPQDVPKCSI